MNATPYTDQREMLIGIVDNSPIYGVTVGVSRKLETETYALQQENLTLRLEAALYLDDMSKLTALNEALTEELNKSADFEFHVRSVLEDDGTLTKPDILEYLKHIYANYHDL